MLAPDKISPTVHTLVGAFHRNVVDEVAAAVARDRVVVVGMSLNPYVKKARKRLSELGVPYTYLEYGGYGGKWKERLAIKLWAGFPTFPMIFVEGKLEGGYTELAGLEQRGQLK